ncbi:MAG: TetR/AcrR family transcriptional regulator C-terminal domain-containing protein [Clostridiales bacterium]|nr:TetR/AcrR family transcriptional regulator C-terminal domain-containing protein [Clostridiales bacterium]
MADSNITKRALAAALRELMEEIPFDKIQIAHICERCDMSRKSFYYHFRDKYDLLNWIFDTEIIAYVQTFSSSCELEQHISELRNVCKYFYDNRNFYRKALKIEGQNSFSDHFRECIIPILRYRISYYLVGDSVDDFELNFFTDAAVCTFERWLLDKNCILPDEFVDKLLYLIRRSTKALNEKLNNEE